jgi:hypothetical protein
VKTVGLGLNDATGSDWKPGKALLKQASAFGFRIRIAIELSNIARPDITDLSPL